MKKQNLIAILGTIAVVANLMVPGLAFGIESQQQGTQVIGCGSLDLNVNGGGTPDINFSFNDAGVSTAAQYTYGTKISEANVAYQDAVTLPAAAFIYVNDTRTDAGPTSGAGCAEDGNNEGFTLGVSATDFTNGNTPADTISKSNLKVVTTSNVTPWGEPLTFVGPAGSDTDYFKNLTMYQRTPGSVKTLLSTTGSLHQADWGSGVYDTAFTSAVSADNDLSVERFIITNASGAGANDNMVGQVGVGVAYALKINANQPGGTYTSMLTYTLSPTT